MTKIIKATTNRAAEFSNAVKYMSGFGNGFETEALPEALPIGRNSPQRCAVHGASSHQRTQLALQNSAHCRTLGEIRESGPRALENGAVL